MYVVVAALLTIAPSVNAGLITVGNLQSDDATNFITDTTTGRMYSRLDATLGRTFSQLTSIDIMAGGSWDGWSIATSVESDDFINALLGGVSLCDGAAAFNRVCGTLGQWTDEMFGRSWDKWNDYWIYETTADTPSREGYRAGIAHIDASNNGLVRDCDDCASARDADDYTLGVYGRSIGFLLYKEAQPVSAPSSLAILALGLIGFAARRFKKQS
jgi:hypothetical protein